MTEDTIEEKKNDAVTVKIERNPGCEVVFHITASPQAVEAGYRKALKVVNKEVSLPGFRKGRAPDSVVEKQFGKYVDQEWRQIVLETAFKDSLDLTQLYPHSKESIEASQIKSISRENGAEVTIRFEVTPEVPKIDPKELEIKAKKRKEVTEEDLEDFLLDVRYTHADWEEVTDRPVESDDFIDVDIVNLDSGAQICEDSRFSVKEGEMGEWMRKLVIGINVGDSAEGVSEKDEKAKQDDEEEETPFQPIRCKITVKKIWKATLPPLDEALAEKAHMKTVDEMREKGMARLNREADQKVQEGMRKQLHALLAEKYPFDIPASYVKSELKQRRENLLRSTNGDSLTAEQEQELQETVDRLLRIAFITQAVVEDNKIEVGEDEILREMMAEMYQNPALMTGGGDMDSMRGQMYMRVMMRKGEDFLIEHAKKQETL